MIVGQYKIVCNCIIGIVWQWKMFAICSSSRIFSRRAFSSEVRFFLDICYTFCVMLLFYTSWEVYTRLGRSRLARLVRLSNQRAKRQRRTPLSRAPQRAAQGGKQQRAFDEIHADTRQLAQLYVQPRLGNAGKNRANCRAMDRLNGAARSPVCPERKKMMPSQRTAGRK